MTQTGQISICSSFRLSVCASMFIFYFYILIFVYIFGVGD